MKKVLVRCSLEDWAPTLAMLPDGSVQTLGVYLEGTTCDATGETVPDGMVHLFLSGPAPIMDPFMDRLRSRGWHTHLEDR